MCLLSTSRSAAAAAARPRRRRRRVPRAKRATTPTNENGHFRRGGVSSSLPRGFRGDASPSRERGASSSRVGSPRRSRRRRLRLRRRALRPRRVRRRLRARAIRLGRLALGADHLLRLATTRVRCLLRRRRLRLESRRLRLRRLRGGDARGELLLLLASTREGRLFRLRGCQFASQLLAQRTHLRVDVESIGGDRFAKSTGTRDVGRVRRDEGGEGLASRRRRPGRRPSRRAGRRAGRRAVAIVLGGVGVVGGPSSRGGEGELRGGGRRAKGTDVGVASRARGRTGTRLGRWRGRRVFATRRGRVRRRRARPRGRRRRSRGGISNGRWSPRRRRGRMRRRSRRSRRRDRARASSPWPREAPPRRGRGAGRGPPRCARARSARSRWRRRAACAAAYPPSTGSLGGAALPRRSVPGAGADDDGRAPVCRSPGPACALPSRRSREPAHASPRDARRSRVDVRAGSIRVGSAVASRDAPARDHAPSARGIFKRASPPRRFEDPAASAPPAMKNTRECGDAKAGNPSAAGVDIRRFIGRNRRFTFDRSVLEPRQSKKFFAKAPSNFPRSPNPGITWLSSDRERIHIGEIFAFSPFSRTQHSTVQLSARALRPIRFVWGAQSSGLS